MIKLDELEQRRQKIGISQSQLCQKAEIHVTTYTKLVRGHSKNPQWRTLSKLRKAIEHFEGELAA